MKFDAARCQEPVDGSFAATYGSKPERALNPKIKFRLETEDYCKTVAYCYFVADCK